MTICPLAPSACSLSLHQHPSLKGLAWAAFAQLVLDVSRARVFDRGINSDHVRVPTFIYLPNAATTGLIDAGAAGGPGRERRSREAVHCVTVRVVVPSNHGGRWYEVLIRDDKGGCVFMLLS